MRKERGLPISAAFPVAMLLVMGWQSAPLAQGPVGLPPGLPAAYGPVFGRADDQRYALTITESPDIGGDVAKSPDLAYYAPGRSVVLTATAAAGYRFVEWSGDATGSTNPLTVTMTAAKSITATFTPQWDIAVTTVGTGTVTNNPVGSPAGTYDDGTAVTLTATPGTGRAFYAWSVDTTTAVNPLALAAIHADKALTATYGYRGRDYETGDADTLADAASGDLWDVGTGSFTITVRVRHESIGANATYIAHGRSNTTSFVLYKLSTNTVGLFIKSGVSAFKQATTTATLAADTAYHLGFVCDRTLNNLYIYIRGTANGTPLGIAGYGTLTSDAVANIGANHNGTELQAWMDGTLTDFRYWKGTALSAAQMATEAANTTPFTSPTVAPTWAAYDPTNPWIGSPVFSVRPEPSTSTPTATALTLPPSW